MTTFHSVCLDNFPHTTTQPVMNNQEQPFSTGASFPAIQQPPPWHPTYKQNVGSSAPQIFYHSAPGVQSQVLYHEQPTATFAQPYVVCLFG